ncbi:MAG: hypothetical protein HUK25_08900 [Treponema sp.]|nr:hypothetical protein [Treponema sp.]
MRKNIFISTVIAFIFAITACQSVSVKDIPQDMTAAQLLQAGQNCESVNNYVDAEEYFKACIQRYGLDNAVYVEARYELGNCYLKENKKDKAALCFQEIVSMYEDSEIGMLPPAYLKLAKIGLSKIK